MWSEQQTLSLLITSVSVHRHVKTLATLAFNGGQPHLGHFQSPSGTSVKGGFKQWVWYAEGQESQHNSSPPSLQTRQNSWKPKSNFLATFHIKLKRTWCSSSSWSAGPSLSQCGQLHFPSGASSNSGSKQTKWYALGQVSHKIISPPCWHTSQ